MPSGYGGIHGVGSLQCQRLDRAWNVRMKLVSMADNLPRSAKVITRQLINPFRWINLTFGQTQCLSLFFSVRIIERQRGTEDHCSKRAAT